MSISIANLWSKGNLPIKDGLYRTDGLNVGIRVDPSVPGGIVLLESFMFQQIIDANPDYTTRIDITIERELPDDAGYLVCGEGSHGSEGFFGRLDHDKKLVWVVYLEKSNPFVGISVETSLATFTSSSNVILTIDLSGPMYR